MSEDDLKFFKFKQFLAQKHLEIGKKELNKKGIKLCGDCPLRFSDDEVRAFPRAFKKNATMGIHSWNIPSLDFVEILGGVKHTCTFHANPEVMLSPQNAFYGEKVSLPIEESADHICAEFVMCYPPGIPILAPGEKITREILEYIAYAREKGCLLTGPEDLEIRRINIVKGG